MIKVLTIEFSLWMVEGVDGARVLGEFAHQDDAVSAIWMHLVQTKRHHAYLLFKSHLIWRWRPMPTLFWGTLQNGLPRLYQEQMDSSTAKRTFKLYKI